MSPFNDLRFCDNIRIAPQADDELMMVPVEEPGPEPFTSEPSLLDEMLNQYTVENKLPGRDPGTSLLLTAAVSRSGTETSMVPHQKFKLWLASRQIC